MKHKCCECKKTYTDSTMPRWLHQLDDLELEVDAGDEVPSGRCPCGGFVYLVRTKPNKKTGPSKEELLDVIYRLDKQLTAWNEFANPSARVNGDWYAVYHSTKILKSEKYTP